MNPKIVLPTAENIAQAAQHLASGGVVAMPTETVYGLGADAASSSAVAKMYAIKGRPANHPVIVHIGNKDQLDDWAIAVPDYAKHLIESYWPGPMTLVLQRSDLAGDFITGGQDTVGVRMPNHPVALALLTEFARLGGKGIVAPSANRFGSVSPTNALAVASELGEYLDPLDLILDGGQCSVGLESTIIDCTDEVPAILRPGAITADLIEKSCGIRPATPADPKTRVSGSLKQHYSPKAKVLIDQTPTAGAGLIAPSGFPTDQGVVRLANPATLEEYGNQLYGALRKADELGLSEVFVILPEGEDLAIAIRDRVTRAAAK